MVLAMAFVAIYCRLSAPRFLLLAHWATGWHLRMVRNGRLDGGTSGHHGLSQPQATTQVASICRV